MEKLVGLRYYLLKAVQSIWLNKNQYDSIQTIWLDKQINPYKILGVEKDATDEEIRKNGYFK